jgi:hypothetical protein
VNELAFRMLWHIIKAQMGRPGHHISLWDLSEAIGIEVPGQKAIALKQLLALGLIEEIPNLKFHYRIKIQDSINRTVYLVEDFHMGNIQYAHFTKERAELSLGAVKTLRCPDYDGLAINEIEVEL